jgi:DtxR family transcriptional regulator, Mn-dependent transcriptional regulator
MASTTSLPSLTSAMEDYLETIYHLEQEKRIARVRDIAKGLGVKMSSVSSALKSLASKGLIEYDPHQYITLTSKGLEKAKEIVRKHEILKRFLVKVLHLNDEAAEDNACRMEHNLDPPVIEKLVNFVEFVEMCPVDQTRWIEGRSDSCDDCISCLEEAVKKAKKRDKAQKTALAKGLTLADADAGTQVMVENIKGTSKVRKALAKDGIEAGTVIEIEERDDKAEAVLANVKGYHLTLSMAEASKILVKPF